MKNRFFAIRCIEAEVHIHLIYCFAALKIVSEKESKDTSSAAGLMRELLLSSLRPRKAEESSGALDSIPRPQLLSLLGLAVSRYNLRGLPIQNAIREVVCSLFSKDSGGGVSNSLMWYLHEKTTINHLAHDLASIVLSDLESVANDGVVVRACMEEVWVNGILAIVAVLVDSCKHGGALLEDFEKVGSS
jgi:hypothetical protein